MTKRSEIQPQKSHMLTCLPVLGGHGYVRKGSLVKLTHGVSEPEETTSKDSLFISARARTRIKSPNSQCRNLVTAPFTTFLPYSFLRSCVASKFHIFLFLKFLIIMKIMHFHCIALENYRENKNHI